mmetsp:Transcript_1995/g.2181  ORF Transcript_1995/g.2181 Transcript_1995/m.2181 type:complete len:87 (-) Transcript_1995:63-323(-)
MMMRNTTQPSKKTTQKSPPVAKASPIAILESSRIHHQRTQLTRTRPAPDAFVLLREMGFNDEKLMREALLVTNDNVEQAIELLLPS